MTAVVLPAPLAHLTLDEDTGQVDCSVCKTGVTAPPMFGGIPRTTMLTTFIVQHAVHTTGVASGLTARGNPSKRAQAAVAKSGLTRR